MAITSIGSLGTATETSTDRSTSCPLSRSVAVGRVVVTWLAVDNTFSVFDPTDGSGYWYVSDSAGNIYASIAGATDERSFHGGGPQIIIAITQVRNALTTSDTITWSAPGLEPGFAYVRNISVEEFDFDGLRWAAAGIGRSAVRNDAASVGSVGITFGNSREWLLLHGLSVEGPDTDSFTWDSDYTQIASIGTNSGTVTDDITLRGGYRIATLGSDNVAVTNTSSSTRDSIQVLVGVCAVPQKSFPVTPILDDFNRANEGPLSAAAGWDISNTAWFGDFATLDANEAAGSGGSFWNTTLQRCVEVYAQLANGEPMALTLHGSGDTDIPNMDGNSISYQARPGDIERNIHVGRSGLQGGVGSELMKIWPLTQITSGVWLGLQRTLGLPGAVGVNHVWADLGGGWEELAAYSLDTGDGQGEVTSGKLALTVIGGVSRVDNFGGGEFLCGKRFKPQIFRRAYGDR